MILPAAAIDEFVHALHSHMAGEGLNPASDVYRFAVATLAAIREKRELFKEDPLMTIQELAAMLKISPSKISTMHNCDKMPKPLKGLGYRTKRFRRADIELWIELDCPRFRAFEAAKERRRLERLKK